MSEKSILCLINFLSIIINICFCSYDVQTPPGLTCGPNEVLNPCPRYCTFDKTCPEWLYGYIRDCPPPPPSYPCIPECFCLPTYLRINGTCRPQSDCCPGPNEEVVTCPNPCPGGTCEQPTFSPCRKACVPRGCQCKKGYVRDANNICIPLSECPKCGKNEIWNPCPQPCSFEMTCYTHITGIWPACFVSSTPFVCQGKCFCKSTHYRHNNGTCVLPNECFPPTTPAVNISTTI